MSTVSSVLAELQAKGSEKTRQTYSRHGIAPERTFGVSIAHLKVMAKAMKGQQALACELFETGNLDAMYLAGLVADGSKLTEAQLNRWAESAENLHMISEYTVPWMALENAQARKLAAKWIKSKSEHVAASGWCTYSGLVATQPDEALNLDEIEAMLGSIEKSIHSAKNRVRLAMNGFVISVGAYVKPLSECAKSAAKRIGAVSADMGDTDCRIPLASAYIAKIETAGRVGRKRKTMRC